MSLPGPLEMLVILVVALLIFGAAKLPEIGRSLGKSIREFKNALNGRSENREQKTEDR